MEGGGALRRQKQLGKNRLLPAEQGDWAVPALGSERRTSGNSQGGIWRTSLVDIAFQSPTRRMSCVGPEDHEEAAPKETGDSAGEKHRRAEREDQEKHFHFFPPSSASPHSDPSCCFSV